ncbi:putative leucine-rich repeat receptor-like protein kinase [Senna tora]|uniref:Putative leucine-rich repeat receptor-like protein kinase n=1 Tax=Senna tora TaxID=362788 RepID=A0A834XE89_9FABA|nr:putative leucine-rich repeat receptor-like protein kinase [Senna tora]
MDNWKNMPPSWSGSDPCYEGWEGIKCTNSRVTSIALASMGLTGHLSGDIASLSELNTLILVGCGFNGPIPDDIGYLQELRYLSLNSNGFIGKIPPSIGNLSKLYWLDLADNQLNGPIPVSSGNTPGLDMLHQTKHFHFGKNKLSGHIPPQLFSSEMSLIHV